MERRYLVHNKNCQKLPYNGVVHNINKQAVNGCRVILLDSALKLQLNPACTYENPKSNIPEVAKRQGNHTVLELNDHISLSKTESKPKVNFVNFIDCSELKTESSNKDDVNVKQEFDQIKVKKVYSEESSVESNQNTNNSLVLVQDRILKTSDNNIIKSSKPVLNLMPGTVQKLSFAAIKQKITLDQTNLKREQQRHTNQLETQIVQQETLALKSSDFPPVDSKSSIDCTNIFKVLKEQQLLNKKITLQRVIKLHPLNLRTFKSSQKNKKHQLSSILKTVIKNNLSNKLQQKSNEEAFPVAIKSIDHEDIKLLDMNQTNQSSEQILGI